MASSEQHGKPMILLVEDEPSEREPIARHLREHGFSVEVVDDSDAALALLKKRSDIRGLVTDAHVPGKIDGFELAALVRERWPELAVVMMSGHSDESSGPIPDGGDFVSKPYLFSHLVPALNRLMGRA
ncbi:MAG TPA: response regulator [Microvirga sp.]|jgi:DNA-binding response OmpR family regulator|nr:response regulator [Microvirga sp.]